MVKETSLRLGINQALGISVYREKQALLGGGGDAGQCWDCVIDSSESITSCLYYTSDLSSPGHSGCPPFLRGPIVSFHMVIDPHVVSFSSCL